MVHMVRKMTSNDEVIVRVDDVECPEAAVVLSNLTSEAELIGKVKFLSDGAGGRDEFAIVDVRGLTVPLVVRLERLRPSGRESAGVVEVSARPTERLASRT